VCEDLRKTSIPLTAVEQWSDSAERREGELACASGEPPRPAPTHGFQLGREQVAKELTNYWPATHKRCWNRSEWLPLEEFPLNRRFRLGRSSWCRNCARAATRDWRARNREEINAERRAASPTQEGPRRGNSFRGAPPRGPAP
jgi:hypothetical protein